MRSSSGVLLSNMLAMSALMQTDLPEPVWPAIIKCGAFAKSIANGSPEISLPSAITILSGLGLNAALSKMSRPKIVCVLRFGISIPTAPLPGIGVKMRMDVAFKAIARSSCNELNWFTFTPGPGSTSKRVITGPVSQPTTLPFTLKFSSFSSSMRPISFSSSSV